MKIKRLLQAGAASVLSLSSLLTIAIPVAHATVNTCVWTGAGGTTTFSTAANWTGCNGTHPQAGDIIEFTGDPVNQTNLTNDLNVTLGGALTELNTSNNYGSYVINTLSLAAGASMGVVEGSTCNIPTYVNVTNVSGAGDLTINDDGFGVTGALTVGGNLTVESSSGYGYLATASGTVTGNVTVASPVTETSCSEGGGGGGGFGNDGLASISGFGINGLTIQNGASMTLTNSSFPITLGGGSGSGDPEIDYSAQQDSNYNTIATTYTNSSNITLLNNALINADSDSTVNFTGAFSGAGYAMTNDQSSEGTINFNPSSNTTSSTTGSQQNPVATTTVTDSQPMLDVSVYANQTLVLDGARGYVEVAKGGTLKGSGTAEDIYSEAGSTVAPGHSPGCLTIAGTSQGDGLYEYGTYQAELGGTTPCSGYDQINVTGVVNLSDTNSDPDQGTLDVELYNGYVPKVGQSYTIITNDGSDAVVGSFAGMAEGASFTKDGVTYTITYKGGDGNDVVLTVTNVNAALLPKKPNTGMQLVAAHPMVSLVTTVAAAGALVYVSRRLKTVKH